MDLSHIVGYFLAIIVGITLGLLGSGGSILSVPILVYVMNVSPILGTAYSLFIVGVTALVGSYQKAKQNVIDYKKVFMFGFPSILSVFVTRKIILPYIPDIIFSTKLFTLNKPILIMIVFAVVMIFASFRMIKPSVIDIEEGSKKLNYFDIGLQGVLIGLVSGFVGAGGGFLIIPALVLLARTPMKIAVGTSLLIVASQSLIGFLADIGQEEFIDWKLLFIFTLCSVVGIFIGNVLSKKIESHKLKTIFGWFVLVMGVYILIKELFF